MGYSRRQCRPPRHDLGGKWFFSGIGDYNGDGSEEILWSSSDEKTLACGKANEKDFKNLTVIA